MKYKNVKYCNFYPCRFRTSGNATSTAVLSLRDRRDRIADDAIPSVQNLIEAVKQPSKNVLYALLKNHSFDDM